MVRIAVVGGAGDLIELGLERIERRIGELRQEAVAEFALVDSRAGHPLAGLGSVGHAGSNA
jgi:hypothetical protein